MTHRTSTAERPLTTGATAPRQTAASAPATVVEEAARQRFLDLSLTQVIGGSLAAATAAALGSRLGLVGTITGAAIISVVSAVSASLYTQSMRRTRDRLVPVRRTTGQPRPAGPLGGRTPRRAAVRVLAAAAAVFAVAVTAITGWELVSGSSLSGDERTTISEVTRARAVAPAPATGAGATESADERTPTDGETSTGTADGEAATPEPAAQEPSATPTPTPSAADPDEPVEPAEPVEPTDPAEPSTPVDQG